MYSRALKDLFIYCKKEKNMKNKVGSKIILKRENSLRTIIAFFIVIFHIILNT